MNKEYTCNIDKYTIGVDENGKDEIGLTIAIIKNGEINFLGNYYGENARCIDLLIKENQELKQKYVNAVADYETTMAEKEEWKELLNKFKDQQKEFIKYLEDEIKLYKNDIQNFSKNYNVYFSLINDLKVGKARTEEILQKYKRITGVSDDNKATI